MIKKWDCRIKWKSLEEIKSKNMSHERRLLTKVLKANRALSWGPYMLNYVTIFPITCNMNIYKYSSFFYQMLYSHTSQEKHKKKKGHNLVV